jgi:hypothetical protein
MAGGTQGAKFDSQCFADFQSLVYSNLHYDFLLFPTQNDYLFLKKRKVCASSFFYSTISKSHLFHFHTIYSFCALKGAQSVSFHLFVLEKRTKVYRKHRFSICLGHGIVPSLVSF